MVSENESLIAKIFKCELVDSWCQSKSLPIHIQAQKNNNPVFLKGQLKDQIWIRTGPKGHCCYPRHIKWGLISKLFIKAYSWN